METAENYVYKKEVDWSLLNEGFTLPLENQVVFGRNLGRFLRRGESKNITMYLDGKSYKARITNVNFAEGHNRKKDTLQIRYSLNGELSNALKAYFRKSYQFISEKRRLRANDDRTMIRLPEDCKEYLAIYTTEYEDTYLLETIVAEDILFLKEIVKNKQEQVLEASFNYDVVDEKSTIFETERIIKLRKLNKKIGDNLKLLYNYRCQICGKNIGKKYDSHIVEAHHIDYFVYSLNNDSDNQLIVCPNHHSIIHNANPIFDRKRFIYLYPNGLQEKLALNQHLK
ncbi:MAG: HNH endonuclease [Clostridia bacterium]|nr:HNH endonuclease [Clostridia bacterium]